MRTVWTIPPTVTGGDVEPRRLVQARPLCLRSVGGSAASASGRRNMRAAFRTSESTGQSAALAVVRLEPANWC